MAVVSKKRIVPENLSSESTSILLDKEGLLVFHKDEINNKITPVGFMEPELFLQSLTKLVPMASDILPKNCIFYEKYSQNTIDIRLFCFEFDHKVQSVKYKLIDPVRGTNFDKTYNLSMPFIQVYVPMNCFPDGKCTIKQEQFRISCSQKPIKSMTDGIFALPINNIGYYGNVCWGDVSGGGIRDKENPGDYARRIACTFFGSCFNNHMYPIWPDMLNVLYSEGKDENYVRNYPNKNLDKWEELTKQDPEIGLKINYKQYLNNLNTFQSFIKVIKGN